MGLRGVRFRCSDMRSAAIVLLWWCFCCRGSVVFPDIRERNTNKNIRFEPRHVSRVTSKANATSAAVGVCEAEEVIGAQTEPEARLATWSHLGWDRTFTLHQNRLSALHWSKVCLLTAILFQLIFNSFSSPFKLTRCKMQPLLHLYVLLQQYWPIKQWQQNVRFWRHDAAFCALANMLLVLLSCVCV